MTLLAWLDLHAYAVMAVSSFGGFIAAMGSWICTVWSDRRTQLRFDKQENDI
jgi:hypothetical protein